MVLPADRMMALEMRVAEQERTIEELSGQIAQQWTVIDRLETALGALRQRLDAVEDGGGAEVPVTRPPHW